MLYQVLRACFLQFDPVASDAQVLYNTTFYSLEMQLVDLACFGSGKVHFYVLLVLANAECASEWRPTRNVMPKYEI